MHEWHDIILFNKSPSEVDCVLFPLGIYLVLNSD